MLAYLIFSGSNKDSKERMESLADGLRSARVRFELIDADSKRGASMTETYDIFARPAVLVTREDGLVVQLWTDPTHMPAVGDIRYLAYL